MFPRPCRSFAGSERWIKPIAKFNIVVPNYFPLNDSTAFISPKWKKFDRAEVRMLRDAGLLECVDGKRHLWMWTHRGNVLTRSSEQRTGGCLSLEFEDGKYCKIRQSMAELMARGVAT